MLTIVFFFKKKEEGGSVMRNLNINQLLGNRKVQIKNILNLRIYLENEVYLFKYLLATSL